jgi:uncharacterized protein YceH (UPF0502 family)
LFSGDVDWAQTAEAEPARAVRGSAPAAEGDGSLESRLDRLEALVAQLQAEVDRLKGG